MTLFMAIALLVLLLLFFCGIIPFTIVNLKNHDFSTSLFSSLKLENRLKKHFPNVAKK